MPDDDHRPFGAVQVEELPYLSQPHVSRRAGAGPLRLEASTIDFDQEAEPPTLCKRTFAARGSTAPTAASMRRSGPRRSSDMPALLSPGSESEIKCGCHEILFDDLAKTPTIRQNSPTPKWPT